MRLRIFPVLGPLLLVAGGVFIAGSSVAATTPKNVRASRSIGSPSEGHLAFGVHLPAAPYLRVLPVCEPGDERWGTKSLVDLIDRAAKATARDFPGARTTIGDLSRHEGGEIDGHASHESGRDVDVLFFSKDKRGKPVYHEGFVAYRADGTPKLGGEFRFDDARTWALLKHMLTDRQVPVSRVFIAGHIRARLLHYAASAGESIDMRDHAASVMVEPAGVLPHDDHFHLRIACPPDVAGCIEAAAPRKRIRAIKKPLRSLREPLSPEKPSVHDKTSTPAKPEAATPPKTSSSRTSATANVSDPSDTNASDSPASTDDPE